MTTLMIIFAVGVLLGAAFGLPALRRRPREESEENSILAVGNEPIGVDDLDDNESVRPERRRSFAGSLVQTGLADVAYGVITLINVLIVARALGVEGRGEVTFLTTLGVLLSQVGALGIHEAAGNIAGRWPESRKALASTLGLLSIALAVVVAALTTLLFFVAPGLAAGAGAVSFWIVFATLPVLIAQQAYSLLASADYRFSIINLTLVAGPAVTLLSNGALAAAGRLTPTSALVVWSLGLAFGLALLIGETWRRLGGFSAPARSLARATLSFGWRAHLPSLANVVILRVDVWILAVATGAAQVGLYSIAVAWREALYVIPVAASLVARPDFVRSDSRGAAESAARLHRIGMLIVAATVTLMIVAAPLLCTTIFGEEFSGSVPLLRILALSGFGILTLQLLGRMFIAAGRPWLSTAAFGTTAVVALALDLTLIPAFGGVGAAWASTVTLTFGGFVAIVILVRRFGIQPTQLLPGSEDVRELADVGRRLARIGRSHRN